MVYLSRRIGFSSAHRYHSPQLSEEDNKRIFGRCYTEHGHGHNYVLDVTLKGEVNVTTGMVINLTDVDQILKEVTDPLDHHHLNFDLPYFKTIVPTTENIAIYCFNEVKKRLPSGVFLDRVRLYESDTLWAECHGT